MNWKKLGLVFNSAGEYPWMMSHATNPVAKHLYDDIYKIYFSSRDKNNRSYITYIIIDINNPSKILDIAKNPILIPGHYGLFDDSGVVIGNIIDIKKKKYLYYMGWCLSKTIGWRNSIGLAIYNPKLNEFEKFSKAPIIDRSEEDPYSLSYPFVFKHNGTYGMLYGSNTRGSVENGHVLKYATSIDGIQWAKHGTVFSSKESSGAILSRASVLEDRHGKYNIWYSYKEGNYRIGLIELDQFRRKPSQWSYQHKDSGIDISRVGWDDGMIEYPFVFKHKERHYMLYNGNDYGKTGFGLATLEKECSL